MSSESCICVLDTWFLFAVEAMDERDCRVYTMNVLLAMDPDLDSPIILPSVTFELFLHYLVIKKKKVEVTYLFKSMMVVKVH